MSALCAIASQAVLASTGLLPEGLVFALNLLLILLIGAASFLATAYLIHYLVTLPLRREQRARFFLTLLESGLRQGKSIEHTVVRAAQSHDRCLGRRFQDIADYLHQGTPLALAARWAPGYLPPQIVEMMAVGGEIGDVAAVLPACHRTLTTPRSQGNAGWQYFNIVIYAMWPAVLLLLLGLGFGAFILPNLEEMFTDMGAVSKLSPIVRYILRGGVAHVVFAAILLVLFVYIVLRIGGPRLVARWRLKPLADRLAFLVPWHRKRLLRDFSAMLAVLLDAGVPEERSLTMAAKSTANGVFLRRASAAVEALKEGAPLAEAVARLDRTGEFRWRLTNACHAKVGFFEALAGWHDALDAKAFQQEQVVAQVIGSILVLCNGAAVAAIAFGFWHVLTTFVEAQFLW